MKNKNLFVASLPLALLLPAMMMMAMSGSEKTTSLPRPEGTCDIYASGGSPCVAAHSTTRALYATYNGPLYQVIRESDGKTLDVEIVQPGDSDPGGYADARAQDAFCANSLCRITKVYDQSGKGNHLTQAPPGTFKGPDKGGFDALPIADMAPITISGHKAYGVFIIPGMGLRNNNAVNLAVNDEPEGIYYVVDGKHYDSGCCFDYGNSSTNSRAVGTGTMETTYYGTSTAWGSGNETGPWIMSDMEAGLFSGYNAKKNDIPAIGAWRFVTAIIDGGGGNKWDLRGGNAQKGGLTTFYSGVRPGTPASNAYSPMNKKGGILLGNGGDNGNGSSGTFYEGVMTAGYPTAATTDAVQANIVAAKYDVQRTALSCITTFTPKSIQNVTLTFTNTTGVPVTGVKLNLLLPKEWTALLPSSNLVIKTFTQPVAPNTSISATFKVTSPAAADAGFLIGKVEWKGSKLAGTQSDVVTQRIRSASPVKINEVRFGLGNNATDQFIELYNASSTEINISNWRLIHTPSMWAPVKLGTIPPGTKIPAHGFYVLGLATSGLIVPASTGDNTITVHSIAGLEAGQQINIDGETNTIAGIGTPASPLTIVYVPVSTGASLTIPAGSTNIPVTSATGFTMGQKIGIDLGGNYEIATVTAVGKAATQANLFSEAKAGSAVIKVTDNINMAVGDQLSINTGIRKELVTVKRIINVVTAPARGVGEAGEIELAVPLKFDHMAGVDIYEAGTGISFAPATHFAHSSGDAVQALGSGITLTYKLVKNHEFGAPVLNTGIKTAGYQGSKPNQWYGYPLSATEGSIAILNASGKVLADGLVYGPAQSNSSANGTVTSPEIATLEGNQTQGGCIVVLPPLNKAVSDQANRSIGRFPDGYDSDSNCSDFQLQNMITLSAASAAGSNNIKVAAVKGFGAGQKLIIGSGANSETAIIASVGSAGATTIAAATTTSSIVIPVNGVNGFEVGQTIIIGTGEGRETASIAAITAVRRRTVNRAGNNTFDTITLSAPLKLAHPAEEQVSGSGITFTKSLTKGHDNGSQVVSAVPTPGAANQYSKKP
jgi:hypothetical protein